MNRDVHKRAAIPNTTTDANSGHLSLPTTTTTSVNASKGRTMKRRKRVKLRQRPRRRARSGILQSVIFGILVSILGASLIFLVRFVMKDATTSIRKGDDDKSMAEELIEQNSPEALLRNAAGRLSRKKKKKEKKLRDEWNIPDDDNIQYRHSDYLDDIGDKSGFYQHLRKEYDELLPYTTSSDKKRMKSFVESLHQNTYEAQNIQPAPYDIHNCPDHPPPHYPYAWNVQKVLENWPPDDTAPRDIIYQGLCVFDYETELEKALNYRKAEVPFVVKNDPKVLRTVERWNQPNYLRQMLREYKYRTEYSPNNHFMYWMTGKKKKQAPKGWQAPTEMLRMRYSEWLSHANITDESKLGPGKDEQQQLHNTIQWQVQHLHISHSLLSFKKWSIGTFD